jgi:hypothetical protein
VSAENLPLGEWANELSRVDGVEAVLLGGSRARGTHGPSSDVDLGLYLCADAGHWVLNEKGAVAQAASLPNAPLAFGSRAQDLLGALGTTAVTLEHALREARTLVSDTRAVSC